MVTEDRENVNNAAAVDTAGDNRTLADIVAEMRRGTRLPAYWHSCALNKILQCHADLIEAVARRAYNEIDSAVCSIEDAASSEIDAVRKAMERTLGDYYE